MIDKSLLTRNLLNYLEGEPSLRDNKDFLLELERLLNDYKEQFLTLANEKGRPAAMRSFQVAMDEVVDQVPLEQKNKWTCRQGCGNCCYMDVDIFEEEAEIINHYCQSEGIEMDRDHLLQQVARSGGGPSAAFTPRRPCVFLKQGSCSIYPVRPLACRKHHVISHAHYCDPVVYPGHKVDIVLLLDGELLYSALSLIGSKHLLMAEALLAVMENM